MTDSYFKGLPHCVPAGHAISTHIGGQISNVFGYRPDVTIFDKKSGKIDLILECEDNSSRKTHLGDILKAFCYFAENHTSGTLIIVVKNLGSLPKHLRNYCKWLRKITNVKFPAVMIISDRDYLITIQRAYEIASKPFRAMSTAL